MIIIILGWTTIALSVIVLLIFGSLRLAETFQAAPATDAYGIRYVQHPGVTLLHIVPGLLFLTLDASYGLVGTQN